MTRYAFSRFLFLRLLGFVYFCAFASLVPQIVGLVGVTAGSCRQVASDLALRVVCIGGALLSLVLVAGFVPLVAVPLLWLAYLWVSNVCGVFLRYQWDAPAARNRAPGHARCPGSRGGSACGRRSSHRVRPCG